MRIFFKPAVILMDRLRYPRKMAVIALVFAVPLLFFMYLLIAEINSDAAFARKERVGAIYNQSLMRFVRDIQQHRGLSNAFLNGDASFRIKISEKQSDVIRDIGAIYELDKQYGPTIPIAEEWNAIKGKWDDLGGKVFDLQAGDSFVRHSSLIDDTLALMVRVAYVSNLTFVPDIESFYLMDTTVNRIPLTAEYIGQIRGLGAGALTIRKLSAGEKARLTVWAELSKSTMNIINSNMQKVFQNDPVLKSSVEPYLHSSNISISSALEVLEKGVFNSSDIFIRPSDFFNIFSRANDSIVGLHEAVSAALNASLQNRIDSLMHKRVLIISLAALTLVIMAYLSAGIYLSVTDSLSRLTHASRRIGSGDMDVRVSLKAKDEMEQVAESFNDMANKLSQVMGELKRSNTELEHFAYLASHDLKSPLLAVGSNLKLFQRRYKGKLDAEADLFISDAIKSTLRMERLISDLLAYSRVGTRGKPFEPTDCSEALNASVANLKVAVEDSGAEITHDALPEVTADSIQIVQLFQNLIGNAIRFRGEAPLRIHISAALREREWVFSVSDNGIGIPPEQTDKIFEIFHRAHGEKFEGTGMGLAICKKIAERHGGSIWVESEPGKGSTFYFTIPMVKQGKDS